MSMAMNETVIEAIYQRDLRRAEDTYNALIQAAEKERSIALRELEENRRSDFRDEQQFFNQG